MNQPFEKEKEKIESVAKKYGVRHVGVYAPADQSEPLDRETLHVLVDAGDIDRLLMYFQFVEELERALGARLTVTTTDTEPADSLKRIRETETVLFDHTSFEA